MQMDAGTDTNHNSHEVVKAEGSGLEISATDSIDSADVLTTEMIASPASVGEERGLESYKSLYSERQALEHQLLRDWMVCSYLSKHITAQTKNLRCNEGLVDPPDCLNFLGGGGSLGAFLGAVSGLGGIPGAIVGGAIGYVLYKYLHRNPLVLPEQAEFAKVWNGIDAKVNQDSLDKAARQKLFVEAKDEYYQKLDDTGRKIAALDNTLEQIAETLVPEDLEQALKLWPEKPVCNKWW